MPTITTPIETGHRIQFPAEWGVELGLDKVVELEKTATGILVRPCHAVSWDEIFAGKLTMGEQPLTLDLSEVSGDDLLL